jgi:hypothetical protein
VCIYHTFALNQFPREARQRFAELIGEHAAHRDLALIAIEWRESYLSVELALLERGARTDLRLANCDAHGSWLE